MTITLTHEEAQQVLDALQCATPPTFSSKLVEEWHKAGDVLRAKLSEPMIDGYPLYSGLPQPKEDQGLTTNPLPAIKLQEDWALGVGFKKAVPESWAQSAQVIGTQKKEWIGLTDEELLDLADMAYANDLELLQTLQAKLKEKNYDKR